MSTRNLGNKQIFGNNLRYLMDQKGVTAKELSKEMNFPYTTVLSWLKGEYYPRIDKVEDLADYFEVSMDVLILEQMEKPTVIDDGLNEKQQALIDYAKTLSEEQAVVALRLLRSLVEAD